MGAHYRAKDQKSANAPGVISILEIYTIDEARRRLRWSDSALRAAKRRGLQVVRSGKRGYVTGREIVRFISSEPSRAAQRAPY